ncbi:MAG: tetrathionate reductase family octaheme c-type cytochrome [Bacteroidota bacterium]|jgi:octaheme c-type cytochrome (tetrathionate reductase family)|nr:tetrathionate reductase family octaheme c-type cytochrome [Bacteroidota bacterium]
MKRILGILTIVALAILVSYTMFAPEHAPPSHMAELRERMRKTTPSAVDHSMFPQLQRSFARPQDVTGTCISCHNHRHTEVMKSNHWNWEREEYIEGRGVVYIGKKNAVNNFCIGAMGNEKSCAKCHIGLGMDEKGFNFTDAENIDCLICHDKSDTYAKAQEQGGAPDPALDLGAIARTVGKPDRDNCGVCHFYGGGGNNVKHGDLDAAMFSTTRHVDVHMGVDGADMTCVDCHITEQHNIAGKLYSLSSMNRNRAYCETCHTGLPHDSEILNEHTLKVACQTCHIPTYAKVNATKTFWDWSTAGKLRDGQPYEVDDEDGNHTYLSIKGTFEWGTNLEPEYQWFNGTASHYLLGDTVADGTDSIVLNELHGAYADADSKIIPVKVHRALQPFDPVTRMLIMPKLYADQPGDSAFWKDFDWKLASTAGMEHAGLPFSGSVDFIKTEMNWPVNHMVAGTEQSVQCIECHTRDGGRLAGLTDFYLPGRDYSSIVETGGVALLLLSFLGVMVHAGIRIGMSVRGKRAGGAK